MNRNTGNTRKPEEGVLLRGLDGANPLGFLAALGAFRLLSVEHALGTTMGWQMSDGTWHPVVFRISWAIEELGTELHSALCRMDKSVWLLDKKLPFSASRLRQEASSAAHSASGNNRTRADFIASLGVECRHDDDGNFEDTALRMVRSGDSSGQGLLAYGKRILESTTAQQLQLAVTDVWQYQDQQCALRWDPAEDRGYALQWRDPSKVGALSVRAGNCLALAALPILPTVPVKGRVETTGFGFKGRKRSSFTWPIWQHAVSLDTIRSLLAMPELQLLEPPRIELARRGVIAVYRSDRVMTSTYYANFAPARRVT